MKVSRLSIAFNIPFDKKDHWEKMGDACLTLARRCIGYHKVSLPISPFYDPIKKIQSCVASVFLFLLFLPLTTMQAVVGLICTAISPSHRKNYEQLNSQIALLKPKTSLARAHRYLAKLSQEIPRLSEEKKIEKIQTFIRGFERVTEIKIVSPKWNHLFHDAICKLSACLARESETVKAQWHCALDTMSKIAMVYPDSPTHDLLTIRRGINISVAKRFLQGDAPDFTFETFTGHREIPHLTNLEIESLIEEHRVRFNHEELLDPSQRYYIAKDKSNHKIVGLFRGKMEEGVFTDYQISWLPSYGNCNIGERLIKYFNIRVA